MTTDVHVYDTTLRDGAQQEGLNLSVADKLVIAAHLDDLGVGFIEGGWPGANPKDTDFFARAARELQLRNSQLAAFGATRRAGLAAADDPQVRGLLDAQAPVVTLVAKSHVRHVDLALRTTREENLAMIRDTVTFLRGEGRRVFLDAEHFFDGYRADRDYALEVIRVAAESGAEVVALCDTNGGMLPDEVGEVVADALAATGARLGIHCHNDTGCAVANSLAAVGAGATHVQGTINGYGERTGNANLLTVVANLQLKKGMTLIEPERMREATHIARSIGEVTNVPAIRRASRMSGPVPSRTRPACTPAPSRWTRTSTSTTTRPRSATRCACSSPTWPAGPASSSRAASLGSTWPISALVLGSVVDRVKDMESRGYTFDAADASFELLLRRELGNDDLNYFDVESWRVITDARGVERGAPAMSEASVKLHAGGRHVALGEGNGPVNALDHALRLALVGVYPELDDIELVDFKVRILDASHGTDAITRVLIEHTGTDDTWSTVGVAANIVEASWIALVDGIVYGLLRMGVPPRR
jgi:2-isopropylmalate synthase